MKVQKPILTINSEIKLQNPPEVLTLRAIFTRIIDGRKNYLCSFTDSNGLELTISTKEAENLCQA